MLAWGAMEKTREKSANDRKAAAKGNPLKPRLCENRKMAKWKKKTPRLCLIRFLGLENFRACSYRFTLNAPLGVCPWPDSCCTAG